jgi:hypothetical protein
MMAVMMVMPGDGHCCHKNNYLSKQRDHLSCDCSQGSFGAANRGPSVRTARVYHRFATYAPGTTTAIFCT